MKVLGLSFGRKAHNCDAFLKEALMGAEQAGAEVSLIQMMPLTIKPCIGCGKCSENRAKGLTNKCILKDDFAFVEEAILDCDALIMAAPVYVLGPTGQVKCMADRIGPKNETVTNAVVNKQLIADGLEPLDPRIFKDRYCGLISVGGAMTPNWVSFGLSGMHLMVMSMQARVVDQMNVTTMVQAGHAALRPDLMDRAFKLGQNVTGEIGKPFSDDVWYGDEQGVCPVCHCDLLTVKDTTTVECPLCGIAGTLSVEGDKVKVDFPRDQWYRSRLRNGGLEEHRVELWSNFPIADQNVANGGPEFQKKLEELKAFNSREIKPV